MCFSSLRGWLLGHGPAKLIHTGHWQVHPVGVEMLAAESAPTHPRPPRRKTIRRRGGHDNLLPCLLMHWIALDSLRQQISDDWYFRSGARMQTVPPSEMSTIPLYDHCTAVKAVCGAALLVPFPAELECPGVC